MSRTTSAAAPPATATDKARWGALAVLCAGQLMIILDATVVNVALPSIQASLGFSSSSLAWVVNAYLIPFAGLLLLAGRLGDLLGRRRVFVTGIAVFTVASLGCGVAQNAATLLAARVLQGAGGAVASAVTLGMVVTLFPEPRERAKAIGAYSFVQSAGGTIGTLAGGILTQTLGWHWIFVVNVPIGAVAVLLATRRLADDRPSAAHRAGARVDVPGAALVTAALALGVYAIVRTSPGGRLTAATPICGAVALALLAAFVLRQRSAPTPLLPLRVLRSRAVAGGQAVQGLMVAGVFGFQFLAVLYLRDVLGRGEIATGAAFLPTSLSIGVLSLFVAPRLIARYGARTVLLPGLLLLAAGLAVLGRTPVNGRFTLDLLPALLLLGISFGIAMPAVATLAMSTATPADSGTASGLFGALQQVGSVVGLAVVSTVAAGHTRALSRAGADTAAALTGGYDLGFRVGAGIVLAAFAVALAVLPRAAGARQDAARAGAAEPAPDASSVGA